MSEFARESAHESMAMFTACERTFFFHIASMSRICCMRFSPGDVPATSPQPQGTHMFLHTQQHGVQQNEMTLHFPCPQLTNPNKTAFGGPMPLPESVGRLLEKQPIRKEPTSSNRGGQKINRPLLLHADIHAHPTL